MKLLPFLSRKNGQSSSPGPQEHFMLITWDCCRYDTYQEAHTPVLDSIGPARQAWTQGTFTYPAHASMFQGMLPHVFGPEALYNRAIRQVWRMKHRKSSKPPLCHFAPSTGSIVAGFVHRGYHTAGTAAMGWFRNPKPLREHFPEFEWTGINGKRQVSYMLDQWQRRGERPFFGFMNFGEAHGPYVHDEMPGANGVIGTGGTADFRTGRSNKKQGRDEWEFDEELWRRQVDCVSYLDRRMGDLLEGLQKAKEGVTIVLCGDHGECFGEEGLYGHGFYHPKIMEVPMLIFRLNEDGTLTDDVDEIARRIDATSGEEFVAEEASEEAAAAH